MKARRESRVVLELTEEEARGILDTRYDGCPPYVSYIRAHIKQALDDSQP